MIETAIAGPLVFLVLFSIFEFGLVFRNLLNVGDAVSDGARIGAIVGPEVAPGGFNGDFEVARSLREGLAGVDFGSIERIVVFKALGPSGGDPVTQMPAACRNGTPVAGRCNVYDPAAAFAAVQAADPTYFVCATSAAACAWPAETRDNGPDPAAIDHIGVYVRFRHTWVTGIFGAGFTVEQAAVLRLEPGMVR